MKMHTCSAAAGRNVQAKFGVVQAGRWAHRGSTANVGCACQRDAQVSSTATASQPVRPDPIVQYEPKARKISAVPQIVPVVHSSAYLLRRSKSKESGRNLQSSRDETVDPADQNAIKWALRQADAYFDRVEADTDEKSTARVLVKNPAAQVTVKTMQSVTNLGAATAPELAKAAVPVGKKLLSVSADMLVAGVGALSNAAKKNKTRKSSEEQ